MESKHQILDVRRAYLSTIYLIGVSIQILTLACSNAENESNQSNVDGHKCADK